MTLKEILKFLEKINCKNAAGVAVGEYNADRRENEKDRE
jgi:hypothetical protein